MLPWSRAAKVPSLGICLSGSPWGPLLSRSLRPQVRRPWAASRGCSACCSFWTDLSLQNSLLQLLHSLLLWQVFSLALVCSLDHTYEGVGTLKPDEWPLGDGERVDWSTCTWLFPFPCVQGPFIPGRSYSEVEKARDFLLCLHTTPRVWRGQSDVEVKLGRLCNLSQLLNSVLGFSPV